VNRAIRAKNVCADTADMPGQKGYTHDPAGLMQREEWYVYQVVKKPVQRL